MPLRSRFSSFRRRDGAPRVAEEPPAEPGRTPDHGDGVARPALIVGLGNPGSRYGNTRHNVGAWCVQLLARRHGVELAGHGRVDRAEIVVDGHRAGLVRPRSFMNECGPPIVAELRRRGLGAGQMLVIHDDLDLPAGRVRIRLQGGHGGNNGMRSLIAAAGTREFPRVRIGIDRPYDGDQPVRDPDRIADWVLGAPAPGDRDALRAAVERVADAVELAMREGIAPAMQRFNAGPPG